MPFTLCGCIAGLARSLPRRRRPGLTVLPAPPPSPSNPGRWDGQRPARPPGGHLAVGGLRRPFHRSVGIWLGGILLGVVSGCLFGASMANRHPVAMTCSVLWWGLYFGCFGWSIAAWIAFVTEPTPVPSVQESESKRGKNKGSIHHFSHQAALSERTE
jgi:hypothetical protein